MCWFRMNNTHDNRQASQDERFSETGWEINKDIIALQKLSQMSLTREGLKVQVR